MFSLFEKCQWQHFRGTDMKLNFNIKIECVFILIKLIKSNRNVYC